MHASGHHPSFTRLLRLGGVAALLITGGLFASQALAEQASSDLREVQSGRLDAGDLHNCAIYGSGSVRCWGEGTSGRLGYGNTNDIGDNEAVNTAGPVDLGAGRTATALASGTSHSCAILDNATVRCWGEGTAGRLGYGNTTDIGDNEAPSSVGPVDLGAGRTALAITAGSAHTCALLDNHTVRCWGDGGNGRLGYNGTANIGDDETPSAAGPVFLGFSRTAVAVAAGKEHTCAILDNGTVRCWGKGQFGRLGYGNTNDIGDDDWPGFAGPVDLGAGRTAIAISAGDFHTCALLDNNTVRCWGEAANGRIGYGNVVDIGDDEAVSTAGPVDLGAGRTALAISAGGEHTCAVLDNNTVRCWGEGDLGRLGYGNQSDIGDNEAPGSVGPVDLGAGRTAMTVTAGLQHTCSLLDDGNVRCWGEGSSGRLGYGNTTDIGDTEAPGSAGPVALGGTVDTKGPPPTAINDTATVAEDAGATSIPVLSNDHNSEGWTTSITSVTQPANGTVVITGGGTGLTYQPSSNYCNGGSPTDNFTYTITGGSTATASMTVTCVDDNPVAVNDSATVSEDANATAVGVLTNDTDVDGGSKTISSASDPANGTVVLTGGSPGAHTGLTYQPDANYCNNPPGTSPDTFTYTLNGGSTATVSMTVTCVDDPPVASNDPATVVEDAPATAINVLSNDTDVDGGPKTISSASDPANGTVVLTGGSPGAHTGLTYQPDLNYCNDGSPTDNFTYTLNGGSTATVSVTVDCAGDSPTAVNDSATMTEDAGATAIDVLANDTDPDGGPKAIMSASDPANGTVVLTGGSPGAHTGLTYQPDANYCNNPPGSPDTFSYSLNGGSTATVSVTVNCVEDNPTAVDDSATVSEDSATAHLNVLANDPDPDGGTKTVVSVSGAAHGSVGIGGGGSEVTYQPDPGFCNDGTPTDDFTYTLNGGSTATVSVTVTCVDDLPTAVNDSATVAKDAPATPIDVLGNDPDPDGGPKTIQSASDPTHGTVVITGGGSGLTYQPDPAYCNDGGPTDNFTYTLNGGSTATVSMSVSCVDDPPTAVNDSATVAEGAGPTAVDVLANDPDPDGGPKAIQSATQPVNGTVVITGGGTGLTYEPDPGYCNDGSPTDNFTYTLNGGSTATVSMTVTCFDDPPTAVDDSPTVTEDDPATPVDVLGNDTDPDGGPKLIQSVTQPNRGDVVITGGGTGLTYQPEHDFCNNGIDPDDFTYTLNGGSEATVAVTITCVDDDPIAVNDSATVAEQAPPTAVDVLANDTDIDDGPPMQIQSVTQPANGTVVITGGGAGLTYEPGAGYCNDGSPTDDFTYTLNGGSTATVLTTVSCTDDPPTAVDDSATVGQGTGPNPIDVLPNDTDPDGGPKQVQSVTQPANGTVVITGGGSGLTYEPDPGHCNDGSPTDNFTYTLNGGSEATVSLTVTCDDQAPTAVDDSATVSMNTPPNPIDVLANDTDPDGGPKQIQSVTQPANGTVVITGGGSGLTYQPDTDYCNNGSPTDDFTYTLNGGSEATVSITINCADVSPTAVDDSPTVTEDDPATPFDVLANDTDPDGGLKAIQSVTQPNRGDVVITGGGTGLTYQPEHDFCNNGIDPDDFTYTLNGGSTATVSVTITCVDDDPIAVDDSAMVIEDSGTTALDVLANDSDEDAGPPTLIQFTTQPANGTVAITGGGTGLTYEPDANYCNSGGGGPDTFTYTLNGGSTATVSVAVTCEADLVPPSNPPGSGQSPSVTLPSGQRLDVHKLLVPRSVRKLATKGIKILATCRMDCRIVVRVSVTSTVMTQMGLKRAQIAYGSALGPAGEERWVTARLTGAARRAMLAYGGGGRLQVDVQALDAGAGTATIHLR